VEDEASVREAFREFLQAVGYTVLAARNGVEALELAERYRGPIQLLITDVIMPQMNGPDLAERLVAQRPETRVLYVSGYTDEAVVIHGVRASEVAFLQKPFSRKHLIRRVREVLDHRGPGRP
jgi:DNA-binding response OmpR family regulator